MGGVLRVVRDSHLLERYRRWEVEIDGESVASVANGRACELPVRCGRHTLRIGHRWLSSPTRDFNMGHGDEVEFACRPRPHPLIWIPYGLASLYRPDLFIVIEPLGRSTRTSVRT
jgi:hypothetical protein